MSSSMVTSIRTAGLNSGRRMVFRYCFSWVRRLLSPWSSRLQRKSPSLTVPTYRPSRARTGMAV